MINAMDVKKILNTPKDQRVGTKHLSQLCGFSASAITLWCSDQTPKPEWLPETYRLGGRWFWIRSDIEKVFPVARVAEVMDK